MYSGRYRYSLRMVCSHFITAFFECIQFCAENRRELYKRNAALWIRDGEWVSVSVQVLCVQNFKFIPAIADEVGIPQLGEFGSHGTAAHTQIISQLPAVIGNGEPI